MAEGQEKRADLLVFDADPAKVYRDLIDEQHRKSGRIERSIGSLIQWGYLFGILEPADLIRKLSTIR